MTNVPIPISGVNRQRTEETKASPARCKVGTDESPFKLRGKRCARVCPPSYGSVVDVGPPIFRIGNSGMCSESETNNSASVGNIAFS